MLKESFGRSTTEIHSGRDKQVPAVKDCRFTQTAFGTVVHDSRGKWLGQYETEDAAVEMLREMAKQSKYIHEYVKNKEYMIVGTERRHGFSQNDVDRQWHQIVDKIRKKQVDGVIVANMSVITDNLIDAFVKIAQVQAAGGIIVTVDDGRLAMQLRGF